eukprot:TRINITY_DN3149_c0_g1_i3.p3 TRINITY_DN3149_c0_g1~~TRINITY_DN3149_c0_g1_i3.p3  ORF type:complete len:147 (-),score=24.76 TRINITY_DN3149_c0_g1_i3:475-915(-)
MVGLALSYMLNIEGSIGDLFCCYCDLETKMVSAERCYSYTHLIQEAPNVRENDEEDWPRSGKIEFRNYSVRYRENTEMALKSLSFRIRDGEKIGVVGRTGSGKSTLCLSLLRILEEELVQAIQRASLDKMLVHEGDILEYPVVHYK